MTATVTPVSLFRPDFVGQNPMLIIPVDKESASVSLKSEGSLQIPICSNHCTIAGRRGQSSPFRCKREALPYEAPLLGRFSIGQKNRPGRGRLQRFFRPPAGGIPSSLRGITAGQKAKGLRSRSMLCCSQRASSSSSSSIFSEPSPTQPTTR